MNASSIAQPTILDVAQRSDRGLVRTTNEDSCTVVEAPADKRHQKGILFIVADGLGGHYAGEVASGLVTSLLPGFYFDSPDPTIESCLVESIRQVNQVIYREGEKELSKQGMGSTVVAAVITSDAMVMANVGDSRGFLLRNGSLKRLSTDHTLTQNIFSFSDDPRRRSSILTQALGPRDDVEPSVLVSPLVDDDVLLLASDGLTGLVRESQIQDVLSSSSVDDAAQILVNMANAEGGDDNITVIVVKVLHAATSRDAGVELHRRHPRSADPPPPLPPR